MHVPARVTAIASLALGCCAPPALAQPPYARPAYRLYGDIGTTLEAEKTRVGSIGLLVPVRGPDWLPRNAGPMSLHWDLSVNVWQAPRAQGGHRNFTQLAGLAVWRHAIGGSASRWFLDLGLGASVFDDLYETPRHRFSTAFQFTQALGLGYRFGRGAAYEVSLRAQHVSNGRIKKPNPGEDLVRLRFAAEF
ncbi:acyloxyacyl hydrolase [Pseudomonas sp. S75]|uniref:acyloxyacyl hydrolase n=1 Tax=unclassified Pseudomonas TaxID=196821 RepID=UPI001906FFB7|nr:MULTISPECIES: acyloxyacyl hydrolase [unclassified Pseudomonas]MBJ9974133.1 acyloxyacyl hydrolase [Pseudomonas sp. S30]MBK0151937.1 acyloxyacyl hydrolase [Pseudomonas sp. S75]